MPLTYREAEAKNQTMSGEKLLEWARPYLAGPEYPHGTPEALERALKEGKRVCATVRIKANPKGGDADNVYVVKSKRNTKDKKANGVE